MTHIINLWFFVPGVSVVTQIS